jgi:hypothetical protein
MPLSNRTPPAQIDTIRANGPHRPGLSADSGVGVPTPQSDEPPLVAMEEELKQISSELAASIRREMDLEDLVDRLQSEAGSVGGGTKRTSDYFSDSGTSSVRYGDGPDMKQEEAERIQRRIEQERAQIRLEMSQRVSDERNRRKAMEHHVRELTDQINNVCCSTGLTVQS